MAYTETIPKLGEYPASWFLERYFSSTGIRYVSDRDGSEFHSMMTMAIDLQSRGSLDLAAAFFGRAFHLVPQSADALMARLLCNLEQINQIGQDEVEILRNLNQNYYRLFQVKFLKTQKSTADALELLIILQNSFEGFHTGSEADWIFIEESNRLRYGQPAKVRKNKGDNNIPRTLIFYWDKDPPAEITQNFDRHRNLKIFDVKVFDRDSSRNFLYEYYGQDCVRMFDGLRHPAEESDFFRLHAINAFGGYYLDVDERIISPKNFFETAITDASAIFILSQNEFRKIGPVHNAFFGAIKGHKIITDAIYNLYRNIHFHNSLSLWLKSGPGPITRAISRSYYRAQFLGQPPDDFDLLEPGAFANFIAAIEVSYRKDARDWRVHEAAG